MALIEDEVESLFYPVNRMALQKYRRSLKKKQRIKCLSEAKTAKFSPPPAERKSSLYPPDFRRLARKGKSPQVPGSGKGKSGAALAGFRVLWDSGKPSEGKSGGYSTLPLNLLEPSEWPRRPKAIEDLD